MFFLNLVDYPMFSLLLSTWNDLGHHKILVSAPVPLVLIKPLNWVWLGLGCLGTKGLGPGLDNYLHFGKIYNSKNYHWNKSERNICHLLGPSKSTIHTARRGTVTLINRKQFVTRKGYCLFNIAAGIFKSHSLLLCWCIKLRYAENQSNILYGPIVQFYQCWISIDCGLYRRQYFASHITRPVTLIYSFIPKSGLK